MKNSYQGTMQCRNVAGSPFNNYRKLKRYILSAKLFKILKKDYTCQSTQGGVSTQVVLNDALGGKDFSCVDLQKYTNMLFIFSCRFVLSILYLCFDALSIKRKKLCI